MAEAVGAVTHVVEERAVGRPGIGERRLVERERGGEVPRAIRPHSLVDVARQEKDEQGRDHRTRSAAANVASSASTSARDSSDPRAGALPP
jgi:hypothetical protein